VVEDDRLGVLGTQSLKKICASSLVVKKPLLMVLIPHLGGRRPVPLLR